MITWLKTSFTQSASTLQHVVTSSPSHDISTGKYIYEYEIIIILKWFISIWYGIEFLYIEEDFFTLFLKYEVHIERLYMESRLEGFEHPDSLIE